MAEGKGWSAGKIVLVIFLSLAGLGVLCCGGLYLLIPDDAKSMLGAGVKFGQQIGIGMQSFEKGFGDAVASDGLYELRQSGPDSMTLLVGVPGEPGEDEIAGLQDAAWELYAKSFSTGGWRMMGVGIGRSAKRWKGQKGHQGIVEGWENHFASAEDLAARTGIEAPPVAELFERIEERMEQVPEPGEEVEESGVEETDGE